MKLARVGTIGAAIFAVATVLNAQTPDFSGTWTLESPASAGRAGGTMGNGPATITQTAGALTIARTIAGADVTVIYKLDGTDSRNMMTGADGALSDSMSNAKWDGAKLTIVTKQEIAGQLSQSTEVWTLAGNRLTIETRDARGTERKVYRK